MERAELNNEHVKTSTHVWTSFITITQGTGAVTPDVDDRKLFSVL